MQVCSGSRREGQRDSKFIDNRKVSGFNKYGPMTRVALGRERCRVLRQGMIRRLLEFSFFCSPFIRQMLLARRDSHQGPLTRLSVSGSENKTATALTRSVTQQGLLKPN
jgi:hypothetical protein